MNLKQLQDWIISPDGYGPDIDLLRRLSAAKSLGIKGFELHGDLQTYTPDWPRLLFIGSILAKDGDTNASDAALMIAHAGLIASESSIIRDACGVLLSQLANGRAIQLATGKDLISAGITTRLGVSEQMLTTRRELEQTILLSHGENLLANPFQKTFWDELSWSAWTSASAPTASGKTYLVLKWLLDQYSRNKTKLSIFLAPTRALVSEIERELIDLSRLHGLLNLRVSSLPLAALGDGSAPTALVFTQERMHIFFNACPKPPPVDIAIIDEAQKLGDGMRGVILQDAIERVSRTSPGVRFVFLSPMTANPEILVLEAPAGARTGVVPSDKATVTQNLFLAEQMPRRSDHWSLKLQSSDQPLALGEFYLHSRPDNVRKRLSYIALAIGKHQTGTLVYANGADEAEKLAWQIYDGLEGVEPPSDPELKELSDFARDIIHPDFQLVDLLKRGVAFHYGNMPSLLRSEIERLFSKGSIRFLICTSTLIEGVNLACHTIVVRGPRKGNKKHMQAQDFWNLAGRAGRWGKDFHGNIVCVDTNNSTAWPTGAPKKARYPIRRETEQVLLNEAAVLGYLEKRLELATSEIDERLEQVLSYILSYYIRSGEIRSSISVSSLPHEYVENLNGAVLKILRSVDLPEDIVVRHSGVSAIALQSMLDYFRAYTGPIENLLPSAPDSDDAYDQFAIIFDRINRTLFPAFRGSLEIHSLITIQWMKGYSLGQIIKNRIAKQKKAADLAKMIRDTMQEVEEVARFKVPKYLSAYIDVLKFRMQEMDLLHKFPENLKFELYLEFGVGTKTLLTLIGLGLSRTSAIAINEFLGADDLDEAQIVQRLTGRRWTTLNIPAVVKREIEQAVQRIAIAA